MKKSFNLNRTKSPSSGKNSSNISRSISPKIKLFKESFLFLALKSYHEANKKDKSDTSKLMESEVSEIIREICHQILTDISLRSICSHCPKIFSIITRSERL